MKLEAGKKYKTRNGTIVKCLAVWTEQDRQGYGASVLVDGTHQTYTIEGEFRVSDQTTLDIVAEYKEPVKHQLWFNLYDDGQAVGWLDRHMADRHARNGCIECRLIEWEVPE